MADESYSYHHVSSLDTLMLAGGHVPRVFRHMNAGEEEAGEGEEQGMVVEEGEDVGRRESMDGGGRARNGNAEERSARHNLVSANVLHGTGVASDVDDTASPSIAVASATTMTAATTTTTTTLDRAQLAELEREMLRDMDAMRRRSDLRSFYTERVRAYLRQRHYHFVDDNGEDGDESARAGAGNADNGNTADCTGNDASRPGGFLDEACMPGPCESSVAQVAGVKLTPLAASASTTDHPSQCASNVLRNDEYFWSSTGSADGRRDECITIRLVEPLNRVRAVAVAPFRARFQFGEPVYPPRAISIAIGTSPNRLVPASPRYRVKKSDYSQLFLLWPSAPPGGYIRITLHGSLQQQLEDMRYYVAVRHVAIFGSRIDGARVVREGLEGR